jgi:hypothetical protein
MAQIIHNISTPNDGAGDKLRVAFDHQNQMNTELYTNKVDKLDGFGLSENNLTDALVATIESLSTNVPTLQEVLDFNHDLINGNNFQGTAAGSGNLGFQNNAFGDNALVDNIGNYVNAFGQGGGDTNTYSNINLFGNSAQADSDNQTVFSKEGTAMARISYNDITANRKYELPDKSGTFALLDDTSKSEYKTANFTAENGYFYVVGSNNTVITDSTPIIGSGYIAFSLRGSSIIGGVTYLDLSLVYRFYTSVGWQSKDMSNQQEFIELNTLINAKLTKTGDTITGNFENTSTGFFQVAQGTTAQRPSSPSNGMIRYNSTTQRTEFYSNGAWRNPARLEGDTFTGNVFAPNLSRIAVKDAVAGSNITGVTTEVLCGTYPIPANTFNANDIMRISSFLAEKTGTAGTCTMRVKVGSSASFGSATTIATYTISGTNLSATMLRNSITLRGGNIRTISPTTSNITDIIVTNVGFSNIAFNPAIDNYIFTSLQLSVGTDSVFQSNLLMTN